MSDSIIETCRRTSPRHFRRGERFLYLNNLDETRRYVALANEAHKKSVKAQYDKSIQPCVFNEGDLVLTYDQRYDKLGKGSSNPCGTVLSLFPEF